MKSLKRIVERGKHKQSKRTRRIGKDTRICPAIRTSKAKKEARQNVIG